MSAHNCHEIIATWAEVSQLLQNQKPDEIYECIKRLSKVIKSQEQVETLGMTVPERQKNLFTIGSLSGTKVKLARLLKRGKRVQNRKKITDRVRWSNLKSSFNNHIKMGMITNSEHVDTTTFIKDCAALFQPRIKRTLKMEQNAVKVYTALIAKFAITKNDEEIIELKHFNRKAEPISPTTNVRASFITHVQEPIQTDIEEFEQQGSGWSLYSCSSLVTRAVCHAYFQERFFSERRNKSF